MPPGIGQEDCDQIMQNSFQLNQRDVASGSHFI